jgi:type VI secretion system Hcp family effector
VTKLFSTPSSRRAVLGGAVGAVGATGAALAAPPSSALAAARMAAANYSYNRLFVTVTGITGDSDIEGIPGAIEIFDCSFGNENTASIAAGSSGASAGKSKADPFVFSCAGSMASPKLFQFSAQGKKINSVTLTARGALNEGGENVDYLTIKMETAFITEYSLAVSEMPVEKIEVTYQKVTYTYRYENQSGTPTPITVTWDYAKNAPIT